MRKLLLLAFLITSASLSAQQKMNFDLARKVSENSSSPQLIDVFVQGNIDVIKQLTQRANGRFGYSAGDIAVVHIPANRIADLVASNAVKRIETYSPRIKPMNDTMLINNNIVPVHAGTAPLPQAYDGLGVVVGFIDTGIDFTHPDFQDSTGKSRIKFLWDQTQPAAANSPVFGYGQEWTGAQIDSGLAAAHNDLSFSGHGTHVAGVAVGNGLATGTYKGVAPKADIIMVALDFGSNSSTLIIDAVDYIYEKAQLLGEPCVINASLGDYYGSHDGYDLQAQLIGSMIDQQPGRAFVAAAGNGGEVPFHTGYTVTSDTNFACFEGPHPYIPMYADTADMNNILFAISADQFSPSYSFRGRTNFSNISDHLGILGHDTIYNSNGDRIATMLTYGDLVGGVYSMEFAITPDSAGYIFRLLTTGSGKFDCYTFDVYANALPSAAAMHDSALYKPSDTDQTIVGSYNCLDNVISVGNYTNRHSYIDVNGVPYYNTATIAGALHSTSSHGPTRDGRIKPDICSPGDMTVAAVVLSLVPDITANYPDALAQGGFHVRDGGTSHSAPSVAGIAALYLQMNPTATATELKQDLLCSAHQDSFTGSGLPDNHWGYGKADAFHMLTGCSVTGINEPETTSAVSIFPNPSSTGSVLNVAIENFNVKDKNELRIYDITGKLVSTAVLKNNTTQLIMEPNAGIYFCNIVVNGKSVSSKKLVVVK